MQTFFEELMDEYNEELNHSGVNGRRVASRLYELSKIGALENGGITRPGYSELEKKAKNLVIGWMKEAGLSVSTDGAGNVFGRLPGKKNVASIASGSHVDSVPNGGNFDGPLGVLAALEVAESWKEEGYLPEKPYEVVIFSDEEGSRFKSGLTGSRAFMGQISSQELNGLRDEDGNTFEEVIESYGSTVERYLDARNQKRNIGTFVEVHIEQGKVLERENQPVGIVSGIGGPAWLKVLFTGEAGHAGNTPMVGRRDPLVAAGSFIQAIEALPGQISDTAVGTVGKIHVHPNGINVIPQEVEVFVDIRDIHEDTRDSLVHVVTEAAEKIAARRNIDVEITMTTKIKPLPIREDLQGRLAKALERFDIAPVYIPSGAGHDAMILGEEVPIAMLFVRSKDGISHNPREWTSLTDCIHAVHILKAFVEDLMENEDF